MKLKNSRTRRLVSNEMNINPTRARDSERSRRRARRPHMRCVIPRVVERAHGTYYAIETTVEDASSSMNSSSTSPDATTTPSTSKPTTRAWYAERRYREFLALHDALTRAPTMARLPEMPRKTWTRRTRETEARRARFQSVLDVIARDRALRSDALVVDFLGGGRAVGAVRAPDGSDAADGSRAGGTRDDDDDDDAWLDDPELEPRARDRDALERLMRSTMRVHKVAPGSGAVERDANAREDEADARERSKPTDDAFARDDFATTTRENVSATESVARAMMSTTSRSSGASSRECDGSPRDAREAVKADDADALRRVLARGAFDVNARDSSGMTLLHLACLLNRTRAVEILLANGADPDARNAQGEAARDVAQPTLARRLATASRAHT